MTQSPDFDDKARKIQDIANKLGWNSDISSLIERVKQIDKGLVQEDEFIYILDWSGKCELIHKLEQFLIPSSAKKKYSIPDLFVIFNDKGNQKPYLIEVKTSMDKKLSWTETYYNGLINYSKMTGIPVLVAWKWRSFDIWTLFELKHFQKSVSNYKIGFEKAHMENMMSKLAGDYFIVPYDAIGFHFNFRKVKIIEQKGNEVTWEMICESIYITGKDGKEIHDFDAGLFSFLFSFAMDDSTTETDTHILHSFIPSPNKSAFAQSIPIRYSLAFANEEINWLSKIKKQEYTIKYHKLYDALAKGIEKEVIKNILFIKPNSEK